MDARAVGEVPAGKVSAGELDFSELVGEVTFAEELGGEVDLGELGSGELGFDELAGGVERDVGTVDCGVTIPPRPPCEPLPLPPRVLGIISISRQWGWIISIALCPALPEV